MSIVDVSRPGTDIVNMTLRKTGDPRIHAQFERKFLSENKQYVVGVTGFRVPLSETSLVETMSNLIYIRRRNVDQLITSAEHTSLAGRGAVNGATLPALTNPADPTSAPVVGSYLELFSPANPQLDPAPPPPP